jgi:hypothetical protein
MITDPYRDPAWAPLGKLELRDALDDHAGQVYEATRQLHATVGGPDLPAMAPWKLLNHLERRRFIRDIADAMTDVHAATIDVGRRE